MLKFSNPPTLSRPAQEVERRKLRDSGQLLIAILLMMAMMVIALTYEAPRIVQQLKRDREEEMIHRGTEYARAIKKYYKKFGQYPTSIEQLENTNNMRFLRKRYKDPLTKDGKWTLLHYQDVAALLVGAGGPGVPAAALASQGQQGIGAAPGQAGSSGFGASAFGSSSTPGSSGGFGTSSLGTGNQQSANPQSGIFSQQQSQTDTGSQESSDSTGSGTTQSADAGSTSASSTSSESASGSNTGTNSGTAANPGGTGAAGTALGGQGLGGQAFGAGAIIGVASKSKDPTIRIYNKKKTYNEWQFIYNPMMDQANVLLRGPYSPSQFTSMNIGTPAGQMNQQNQQQSPFGQQNSPFGGQQQPSGSGSQTLTPGSQQFPPDQNH